MILIQRVRIRKCEQGMSVQELVDANDAAAFVSDLLANIRDSTPDLIYAKDTQSRMIFANKATLKALGKTWDEIRGKSDLDWHLDKQEAAAFVEADARIMSADKSESLEETLTVDGIPQTFLSTKCPLRAADGRVIGLFGISMNITMRKNDERLRTLLMNELDHRVRNTLALVQAMARQTLKHAGIETSVWAAFEERLQAMAQAHRLLTRDSWEGADIRQIIAEVLKVHGTEHVSRFDIAGSEVWIDAQNALALAMAIHELGTNAIKYGALSNAAGRVSIEWKVDLSDMPPIFDFHWQETGGPEVQLPSRRGFGTMLIEQAFGRHGRDVARVDYVPCGVRFHARFPLQTS